jgi:hypothetical protein
MTIVMKVELRMKKVLLLLLPFVFLHAQALGPIGLSPAITTRRVPGLPSREDSSPNASVVIPSRVFPRILSDSNFETTFVLINTGSALVTFQQFFFAADGKPASYTIHTQANSEDITTSALQGVLAPGSSLRLDLSDTSGSIRGGWSVLTYDNGPGTVDGYAIIRRRGLSAAFNSETTVASSNMQDYSVYMPFDNTLGFRSQVTLVNPAANLSSQVRLTYLNLEGQVLLIDSLTLLPEQQVTLVLPDTYPDLANKSGSVLVESDIDRFSVTGLRCNDAYGTIAALPTMNRSASLSQ